MAKRGVKTIHTKELADEICRRVAEGESLREVCRTPGYPADSTVRLWYIQNREGFAEQYALAKQAQAERWADELLEIADDGTNDWIERKDGKALNAEHINRSRLRVDTRKWLLAKVLPKVYGDKLELSGDVKHGTYVIEATPQAADLNDWAKSYGDAPKPNGKNGNCSGH